MPKGWKSTSSKAKRKKAGLSLRAVAAALGVAHPTVYGWECGEHSPTQAQADAMAKLYKR